MTEIRTPYERSDVTPWRKHVKFSAEHMAGQGLRVHTWYSAPATAAAVSDESLGKVELIHVLDRSLGFGTMASKAVQQPTNDRAFMHFSNAPLYGHDDTLIVGSSGKILPCAAMQAYLLCKQAQNY